MMSILAADSLWQKQRPGGTAFRSFIRMNPKPTVSMGTMCVVGFFVCKTFVMDYEGYTFVFFIKI